MPTLRDALQRTGIRRSGGPRNGFRFTHADGRAAGGEVRERLVALRIPPAWRDVVIAPDAGARLQAVGRDAKGRWQYLYRAQHTARRARSKFDRVVEFGRALPQLRRAMRRDLAAATLTRHKACAIALLLLTACPLRAGGRRYAREHGTFGIASLRPEHVRAAGDRVTLGFRGKKGVRQRHVLHAPRLARLLRALGRAKRRELFHYEGPHGRLHDLTEEQLNRYVRQATGERFTAKDFRTWGATLLCAGLLARSEQPSRASTAVVALAATARWLGNTPAVARESYVHPRVLTAAREGCTVRVALARPESLAERLPAALHPAERALLRLLAAPGGAREQSRRGSRPSRVGR